MTGAGALASGHVFIAVSLDGFVARPDHGLDWLMRQPTAGEDHGYDAFVETVDGLVMGRGTFETVLAFDAWPYAKPVVVMSSSLTDADVPEPLRDKVSVDAGAPAEVMATLGRDGWRNAYVDGGLLVQSFLRAGLIETMTITIVPVLIGKGRRLFGPTDTDIDLELIEAKSFGSGLVRTRYRVRR